MQEWVESAGTPRLETLGVVAASSRGTLMTTGNSSAKGSYVSLGTAGFTYEYIVLSLGWSTATDHIIDLQIYDGANGWIIAPDLRLASVRDHRGYSVVIGLPLHIPSGSQLRVRGASRAAAGTNEVAVILTGYAAGPGGAPGFSRMINITTPSTCRGVTLDAGGTAHTKTRVELVASSAAAIRGLLAHIGPNSDTGRAAVASALMDIDIGAAGQEAPLASNLAFCWGIIADQPIHNYFPIIPCRVPASTRFSANGQCSDNTAGDRTWDVSAWGFV